MVAHSRASWHDRACANLYAVSRFFDYLFGFFGCFWRRAFGASVLGRELGFIIALINPFRGKLD